MPLSYIAVVCTILLLSNPSSACLPGLLPRDAPNSSNSVGIRVAPRPLKTKTALLNVKVFDGYVVQPLSTIFLDGDTITDDPTNVDYIVDGQGGIVLPGLIDSHCHPSGFQDLEDLSSYGVTTAISMSCIDYELCASLRDQVGLTSYFTAGYAAIGPNSDHAKAQHTPENRLIWSPQQAPDWVENVFNNGSDFLKITSEENGPDQATQNALVAYTHAKGRKVMTHAAEHKYYTMAIASGSDGPQHIPFDKLLNNSLLEQMASQNQFATPTMILYKTVLKNVTALLPEAHNVNYTEAYGIVKDNVFNLLKHGIPVLAGTDSARGLYPITLPFGSSVHDEIANLVEIGLSPAEALRSATLVPALAHRLWDRGRIAPSMRADMMLLQPGADPMSNIDDTRKIAKVWNGGIEYTNIASSRTLSKGA